MLGSLTTSMLKIIGTAIGKCLFALENNRNMLVSPRKSSMFNQNHQGGCRDVPQGPQHVWRSQGSKFGIPRDLPSCPTFNFEVLVDKM